MDSQNLSAPSCAQPRVPRGVTHINVRHSTRFTVVGNHLAQHRELTLSARGLALHIQSLPEGARVDIKSLAARLPDGEMRIAAALRELEAHGYLSRRRERLPSGQIVTHTVSYNQPHGLVEPTVQPPAPDPAQVPELPPTPVPAHEPASIQVPSPGPETGPAPGPNSAPVIPVPQAPSSVATPTPTPAFRPAPAPKRPLPTPDTDNPDRDRAATALLASLHREDPRLLLAERDVHRLAPAVAAWLERGAASEAVRLTLAGGLPRERLHHPASLLAHRLTELLPPRLPAIAPPVARSHPQRSQPHPLQNCDGCDRAFRSPDPGRCRDCRSVPLEAA
ncbi:helix-turn-helix domain-containing protein [Streptomyces sp. NPDC054766]|uniref:helix-turn-helix domain-containing protein n=1 Tax=Streptomyces rhizosphaerihabitans TaxID=1266770 RepID=UPI0021C1B314|nr:helix-turn-helix domain-containing protein [Streptomyces rhizosphaerihabitans]MCT9006939.1 helix-turn-helix domain-containing protein [Streptomyces rhizosphaerihabitans]